MHDTITKARRKSEAVGQIAQQNFSDAALLARRDPLVRLVEYAATNLARPPRYRAIISDVPCGGEALSKVLWLRPQWGGASFGIEARDGTYTIRKDRLLEGEREFGRGRHMSAKFWV